MAKRKEANPPFGRKSTLGNPMFNPTLRKNVTDTKLCGNRLSLQFKASRGPETATEHCVLSNHGKGRRDGLVPIVMLMAILHGMKWGPLGVSLLEWGTGDPCPFFHRAR